MPSLDDVRRHALLIVMGNSSVISRGGRLTTYDLVEALEVGGYAYLLPSVRKAEVVEETLVRMERRGEVDRLGIPAEWGLL